MLHIKVKLSAIEKISEALTHKIAHDFHLHNRCVSINDLLCQDIRYKKISISLLCHRSIYRQNSLLWDERRISSSQCHDQLSWRF